MTSLLCLEGDAVWSHSHITGFHFESCKRAFARDGSPGLPVPISLGGIANPAAQGEHNTCVHAPPPPTPPPSPPTPHFPCTSRVKICKVPQSSKQKLQRKIGQMRELKCIPGDTSSSISRSGPLPLVSPTVPASRCTLAQTASPGQMLVQVMITWMRICHYLGSEE